MLKINDLEKNQELDRAAMQDITGGVFSSKLSTYRVTSDWYEKWVVKTWWAN